MTVRSRVSESAVFPRPKQTMVAETSPATPPFVQTGQRPARFLDFDSGNLVTSSEKVMLEVDATYEPQAALKVKYSGF